MRGLRRRHLAAQLFLEDLEPGLARSLTRVVTEGDIDAFGDLTGDHNPIHFDEEYAATTQFGGRIAHGMFTAGLISTVLGMQLPGKGAVYLGQTLRFRAPVRPGDRLVVTCTVREVFPDRRQTTIDCRCTVGDTVVADGEARVLVPSRAD